MAAPPAPLTDAQKEAFLSRGYIHLKNCFTKEQADEVVNNVWTRLGMDPQDKSTWTALRTNMPFHNVRDIAEFAPKAWAAICELCGGEEKIAPKSREWRDALIVNLGSEEFEGKEVDPRDLDNWHVDGDFFIHYLDSPEQGLLVTPLFSDIKPGCGGTAICPEGIGKVAKYLHDHPEGVSPRMVPRGHKDFGMETGMEKNLKWFCDTAKECTDFVEITGETGDVFVCHPLMLHSASTNPKRQVRIITNPPVHMKDPFEFNRADGKYSLIEQKTLKELGKESLPDWKIACPREGVVPERLKRQAKMKEQELERLKLAESKNVTAAA
jgi:hypothetical protein